jgi:2-methylisocitrate lyase-like PEP mutase family enzyme
LHNKIVAKHTTKKRSKPELLLLIIMPAAKNTTTSDPNISDNSMSTPPIRSSTILRRLLQDSNQLPLACPGVYDGLTARLALSNGFQGLYMTGAGISLSRLGFADLGLTTLTEMATSAAMISQLDSNVPVIADADTGYGGTLNVARTTREYIRAGLAGFHLEDQIVTKKCGHLAGKQLVDIKEYVSRIRAAVHARKEMGSDIVIIARSDALAVTGFDDAVKRLKAAVEAGADVAFLEAISTKEEAVKVCQIFNPMGIPVMYGMVQGTHAPQLSVAEAKEIGFSIIVYASICLSSGAIEVQKALNLLKETGDCEHSLEKLMPPKKLFEICGLDEFSKFDAKVGLDVDRIISKK